MVIILLFLVDCEPSLIRPHFLSFCKEELAELEKNYVHIRARYDRKEVTDVMHDMSAETIACYQRALVLFSTGRLRMRKHGLGTSMATLPCTKSLLGTGFMRLVWDCDYVYDG